MKLFINRFFLWTLFKYVLVFVGLVPIGAQAVSVVVPGGAFTGVGNLMGVDGYGHEWSYDTNDEGTRLIWSMPEIGMNQAFEGPDNLVNGFYIEFNDASLVIDMMPPLEPGYMTQFSNEGSVWDVSISYFLDKIRIDFIAPEEVYMLGGDYFSAMVVFNNLYDPSAFSFSAGWLHLESASGFVAEPESGFLMLLGLMVFLVYSRINLRKIRSNFFAS